MIEDDDVIDGEVVDGDGNPVPVRAAEPYVEPPPPPPEVEYEIEIIGTTFDPGYVTMTVEFIAHGAPVMSWSKMKAPNLRASIPLRAGGDPNRRLAAGSSRPAGGSALVRGGDDAYSFSGMGSPDQPTQIPTLPDHEVVVAACKKQLQIHLDAVEKERARLAQTENHNLIGKKFKVNA